VATVTNTPKSERRGSRLGHIPTYIAKAQHIIPRNLSQSGTTPATGGGSELESETYRGAGTSTYSLETPSQIISKGSQLGRRFCVATVVDTSKIYMITKLLFALPVCDNFSSLNLFSKPTYIAPR
jgi:hypothetical protein